MKQKPKIVISNEIKNKLDKLKQHPRETYEDIIKRLIENAGNKIQDLSDKETAR